MNRAPLFALMTVVAGCNAIADWDGLSQSGAADPAKAGNLESNPETQTTGAQLDVTVVASDMSAEHTCALVGTGPEATANCWGRNVVGQLGAGDTTDRLVPTPVVDLRGISAIATGLLHTCAIDLGGAVFCWGSNMYAALGRGTLDNDPHPKPERVLGLQGATKVSCGMNFSCAITEGRVSCWGTNDFGQLGDGTTARTHLPKAILALNSVKSLSTGGQHACAVAQDPTVGSFDVHCWGFNDHGQIGKATGGAPQTTPFEVTIPDLDDVAQVVTGDAHTCAILESGALYCWGQNNFGQLGVPASADKPEPVKVPLSNVTKVAVGATHTCALANGEALYCWGSNDKGQLGVDPAALKSQATPRLVSLAGVLEQVSDVTTRGLHTCALRPDGSLLCWGHNDMGQLGIGTRVATSTPSEVKFFGVSK